jgi:hypothetical protein
VTCLEQGDWVAPEALPHSQPDREVHPSDFRVRTLDGVSDDWPFTYQELQPFYDLSDRITDVSALAGRLMTSG